MAKLSRLSCNFHHSVHSSFNQPPSANAGHSAVRALADQAGIVASYTNMGGDTVETSVDTLIALLDAMGFDASTEAAARREIERRNERQRQQLIEPVTVLPESDRRVQYLRVRLPQGVPPKSATFHVTVDLDCGERERFETRAQRRRGNTVWLRIPEELDLGYHTIDLRVTAHGVDLQASQRRIVHPRSCTTVDSVLGSKRAFGVWANLYTIRNDRNMGVGDLTDLARLVDWAQSHGADFVGVNPLHSLRNRDEFISPYTPNSRLFKNELYLDLTAVPEFAECPEARAKLGTAEDNGTLSRLRATSNVEYEAVDSLKLGVLRQLFEKFRDDTMRTSARRREFSEYKHHRGKDLQTYATFRALEQYFWEQKRLANWRMWPQRFRQPNASGVDEFRNANSANIDFYCYVQFELDRQMAAVSSMAQSAMALGIYGDLALGSDPTGADAWANQDILLDGVHIGAPPDDFSADGQNWGLPPMSPEALHSSGFDYWSRLLRANLQNTGALRLDHAMGLFRQYWIPAGMSGSMGSYVKYPARSLLGTLALESARSKTIVVGEDLGTVPQGFQSLLARWGILSSRVLYFERGPNQAFRPRREYSQRAMVTANTHDLVPLAGYWKGRDLTLRRDAGGFSDAKAYDHALEQRQNEQMSLQRMLARAGSVSHRHVNADGPDLIRAAYVFLAGTPSPLLGLSLDDLAGEVEPVNLPGVSNNEFPSWSRKMHVSLEELSRDSQVAETLRAVASVRSSRLYGP